MTGLWDIFEQNWGLDPDNAGVEINFAPRSDLLAILDHNPDDDYDYGHSDDEAPVEEAELPAESPQLGLLEEGMEDSQYPTDEDYPEPAEEPLPSSMGEILDESQREPRIDPSGADASVEMPPPPVPPHPRSESLENYSEKCRKEILSKMAVVRLGHYRVCP